MNELSKINSFSLSPDALLSVKKPQEQGKVFEDFYRAAMDIVNETNMYQNEADRIQLDIVTGKSNDMIALSMAQTRAYSSLEFTVQITNKILESYRQIMQIQL